MNHWLALIISLPTANASTRMRAWRALKACGAAVLRDGAYLLPDTPTCREAFAAVERDICANEGSAYLLPVTDEQGQRFTPLFERDEEYRELSREIDNCRRALQPQNAMASAKQARKLRKTYAQIAAIDFFPGPLKQALDESLRDLESAVSRALSQHEPSSVEQSLPLLDRQHYRGRIWATRRRPWIDRLACAWLIRRFIDPDARILWLESPEQCPPEALGFDFDGATFSHVGDKVSFETLLASFALTEPGLNRIATLVHYLDVGGNQPPEAVGIEQVLAGLRETHSDDDRLLEAASTVLDGLLAVYEQEA